MLEKYFKNLEQEKEYRVILYKNEEKNIFILYEFSRKAFIFLDEDLRPIEIPVFLERNKFFIHPYIKEWFQRGLSPNKNPRMSKINWKNINFKVILPQVYPTIQEKKEARYYGINTGVLKGYKINEFIKPLLFFLKNHKLLKEKYYFRSLKDFFFGDKKKKTLKKIKIIIPYEGVGYEYTSFLLFE